MIGCLVRSLGVDTLADGLGNDVYFVIDGNDQLMEYDTSSTEWDQVNSAVSYTLGDYLEKLALIGTDAIDGTGNALDNVLWGNRANNVLLGHDGNDILNGGKGNDTLTGGTGQDVFRFTNAGAANSDKITDFVVADDTIQLENEVFSRLATIGVLDNDFFIVGTSAADANDYLIYNNATGALLYDVDGNGSGAAVPVAVLGINIGISHADFIVI